jgi:hypothetical protein
MYLLVPTDNALRSHKSCNIFIFLSYFAFSPLSSTLINEAVPELILIEAMKKECGMTLGFCQKCGYSSK